MPWEATHWRCSVCTEEIPKDKIFIELKTDALICEDCLEKKRKEGSGDEEARRLGR